MLLRDDDVERIIESGEEIGLKLSAETAKKIWEAYEKKNGNTHKELPVNFYDLMDIVLKTSIEIGVIKE